MAMEAMYTHICIQACLLVRVRTSISIYVCNQIYFVSCIDQIIL